MVVVVLIATIGYFKAGLQNPDENLNARPAELDPLELEKRQVIQDFDLIDAEGKSRKFSEYKGQVVLLSFWSSTCVPCLLELPTFGEIEKKFFDRGFRVVAINVDDLEGGKTFSREFWSAKKLSLANFFDIDKKLIAQFEIEVLPTNLVIDRAGRIVFTGVGANDWNNAETLDSIEALLAEK